MDSCFLCGHVLVPSVPPACKNASLRIAYEGILHASARNQPVNVADYDLRLFERQKICLLQEKYDTSRPKISLTNSLETAIVQACSKYGICPSLWTFVEHATGGQGKHSYHEYDMIVLTGDDLQWKYLWHSDCKQETEPYSDALLIRRVEQYRNGANTVL